MALAIAALSCIGLPVHAQQRGEEEPTPRAASPQVSDMLATAVTAIDAGRYEAARVILLETLDLEPSSAEVYGALGRAELELGRYSEAAEHLDRAIRDSPKGASSERVEELKAALSRAKQHVATVQVITAQAGQEIRVDDRVVGRSPLGRPIFLPRGTRTIEARDHGEPSSETLWVEPGVAYVVDLGARDDTAGPQAAAGPQAVRRHPAGRRSIVPVIAGTSLAAVGVGAFVGFSIAARSDDTELSRLMTENGDSGCLDRGTASCATQRDLANSYDRNLDRAIAGLALSGVAAVGTIVYWYWPMGGGKERASDEKTRLSGGASVISGGARLHVGADF